MDVRTKISYYLFNSLPLFVHYCFIRKYKVFVTMIYDWEFCGTFVVPSYFLNYLSPFSSIFVVLFPFYHSSSGNLLFRTCMRHFDGD